MKIALINRMQQAEVVELSRIQMLVPTYRGPAFIMDQEVYHYPLTTAQLLVVYQSMGFEQLDRNNIANVKLIKSYDRMHRKAYFDSDNQALYATVSRSNEYKLPEYLKEHRVQYLPCG